MPLQDLLNTLLSPSPRTFPINNIEQVGFLEVFILSIMIVSILWLISLSISLTLGSADAFRGLIKRNLNTEMLKEIANPESIKGSFRESFRSTSEFLDDLAPPFRLELQDHHDDSIHSPDVTHFLFLMHGHRGQSKDLAYMQTVMKRIAATKKRRSARAANKKGGERKATSKRDANPVIHDMVVHNAVCNEHRTDDGIPNGGDRLVEEMLQVIDSEMEKRHPNSTGIFDITISILGNSLGGLYGRYAIAKLVERHCVKDEKGKDWILDGRYRVHLNVFCTTATPHLGVSKHTFLPIPRKAEIAAATIMKDTGKDLFRMNDLLHTMATCPTFLGPLSSFRKRIAYANAFNTDFPVPTATAAFLSENSTYPHYFEDESLSIEEPETTSSNSPKRSRSPSRIGKSPDHVKKRLFVASLYTRTMDESHVQETADDMPAEDGSKHKDEFHHMSECLDRLGWKKVFIDIRSELPTVEIPKALIKKRKPEASEEEADDDSSSRCIHSLKRQRKSLASRDLASAVALPSDNRVSWPLGHNMIVAFSRSRMSTLMNKGGRPVVDAVATELVEDIFTWNRNKSSTQ